MDTANVENGAGATSVGDVSTDFDTETDKVVFPEGESPSGEDVGDIGIDSTTLTRLELSLAGFSEKITNLSIFMMRLATMDSEFEAFVLEKDHMELDSVEKGLEFDL
ncbi:WPP domain-interacting tail-anchored protein 1-like, partial [Neltuma alba]